MPETLMSKALGLEHYREPVPEVTCSAIPAERHIYCVGWKLGAAVTLLQSSQDSYSPGVCTKRISYARG